MAGRRHAADGGYPYGDSDGEEAQDDDADAAAIRTALNAIPAAAEGGGGGDLPDFARSSFARSLFASAGAGGAESGAGAGAGAAAGARAAASSAAHAAAEHAGHQHGHGHGHGHTSAPAGLALQVLDSLENAESAAALTSAVSDDVDSSAALTDDVMGRLYPTSGGGGGGGSAGVSAAGRSSIGSNAMGAMGHASDGAIVYGGGGDGGGGGAAAAASAAAAAAAASSAAGRRRTPQRIGQGYSDAVQRPDTDEAQLRESYRIMALNEARALSMERTGYDPASASSDAGGGVAGAEADAADDENDGGGGRIRPRTARERPPPPKPKRGRPPPPPHPIEPPMPAAPRMALANINDKYTAEWRNVPDLCTGEVVELSGDGSSSDGGGDAAAAAAAAGGGLPASVLLERAILGDDEHLVRCLACSRGLRVHKMASLVRCAVCAGVSPATSLR
mmetsp:Transcript_32361/g.71466  ORF Transcript_32361/g.71466 Transcript_32361/m.71466 type:complete len:448 (-) Transcript_32361:83-1426(-)